MPEISLFIVVLQIYFCVHAYRHGKDWLWILFIILVPVIGCAVYFFTQIFPELVQNRKLKRAGVSLINTLDPQREIRHLQDKLEMSDSIENRLALADACLAAGQASAAIALYEKSLTGIHQDDPDIMLKLAQANFENREYSRVRELLEKILSDNPQHKTYDTHLLYAKVLEALDQQEQAAKEYEILTNGYPGEEARVRYGLLLKKMGQEERAQALFKETMTRIKRAPRFYLKKEKHWIEIASANLK
jgi:hypothetical protein